MAGLVDPLAVSSLGWVVARAAGSPGHDGHPLEVVGEHAQADPGARAGQAAQAGAPQPERALELADPRLDPDPPGAHALERAGLLQLPAGRARRARAGQPDPLDAKPGKGVVVAGGPKPAVTRDRARRPPGQRHDL